MATGKSRDPWTPDSKISRRDFLDAPTGTRPLSPTRTAPSTRATGRSRTCPRSGDREPEAGLAYRQEYYAGEAEDAGEILSLDEQAQVPFGSFEDVLMTKDWTPLDPKILEHEFYAKGIGPVLAQTVSGGSDREELLSFEPGG
jgi:hypothetical protein